jgi:hypothetical protein
MPDADPIEPIGGYLTCGTVSTGLIGAPTMTYKLLVPISDYGPVTGQVHITQPVNPPVNIWVEKVHGSIHYFLPPPLGAIVELEGTYVHTLPPPAIGEIILHFRALLYVTVKGGTWDGHGSFSFGSHKVPKATVKGHPCILEKPE